jgi:hypothetical protein
MFDQPWPQNFDNCVLSPPKTTYVAIFAPDINVMALQKSPSLHYAHDKAETNSKIILLLIYLK